MRQFCLAVLLIFPFISFGQLDWHKIKRESEETFAYRISAVDAEYYLRKDTVPVDQFADKQPTYIFKHNIYNEDSLAKGHYVLISISNEEIKTKIISITGLFVYPNVNGNVPQLEIRRKTGSFVTDAKVWVNNKEAKYMAPSQNYRLKQKKIIEDAFVRVYADDDSTLVTLTGKAFNLSANKQRWNYFKTTKFGYIITWVPIKVSHLFNPRYHAYRYKNKNLGTNGYMLFSQPKYKLTDTVRFKAYIVDKKGKQYKTPANVYLEYYSKGQHKSQLLINLKPSSPGSYLYEFPLSDTLASDLVYTIIFKELKEDKKIIAGTFKIEDYVLDEIGKYNFTSKQERYYKEDSLVFSASAVDANNLPLLDAKTKLIITTEVVGNFFKDSLYVPDTLYTEEKKLASQGDTRFAFSASILPKANLTMKALLQFRNSNNELQEKQVNLEYSFEAAELTTEIKADSVFADYKVAGKSVYAKGKIKSVGSIESTELITFPYKRKIDPFAEAYKFYVIEKDSIIDVDDITVKEGYRPTFSPASKGDTIGFELNNPYKIPISYLVISGNRIIATGKGSEEKINWSCTVHKKRTAYKVMWQYVWAGKQREQSETIGLTYKLLKINIAASPVVYPGQKDSITINVTDYKDKPAVNVNLAAVSYNSQFKNDLKIPSPPYLAKYKLKPTIKRGEYDEDTEDPYHTISYPLGEHQQWRSKFGVDSLLYYQMLFPSDRLLDIPTRINSFIPQFSVHVVKKGKPQTVYLLYINKALSYYAGTTDATPYAFSARSPYVQIGIRVHDKYIEIDSIYIQANYKHDLVIDLDHLPTKTIVYDMPDTLTPGERDLIEYSFWQLDGRYETNEGYVWQNDRVFKLSTGKHLVGPFNKYDSVYYFKPGSFNLTFNFEYGYEYSLSPKIARLEKKTIFPQELKKISLRRSKEQWWHLGDTLLPHPIISYPRVSINDEPYISITSDRENTYSGSDAAKLKLSLAKDTSLWYVILRPDDSTIKPIVYRQITYLQNVKPGIYTLLLVAKNWKTASTKIEIKPATTLCIKTDSLLYKKDNNIVKELIFTKPTPQIEYMPRAYIIQDPLPAVLVGHAGIQGRITDEKGGLGIPYASIIFKGTSTGATTDLNGYFALKDVREGTYTLVISALGYNTKQIVERLDAGSVTISVKLSASTQYLNDVVVVGYGTQRKSYTASAMSVASHTLQGRLAGVDLGYSGMPGASTTITIRGMSSISASNTPLYVVDGIVYTQLPTIAQADIESINILKGSEATAIYGSRAVEGVIVITTKGSNLTLRTKFRDYAFWKPELFTGKEGKVSFSVTYPDNITGWEMYVIGMDKKNRVGTGALFTKAFKPIMAQLSTPQFLIEGDSAELINKTVNYTSDVYEAKTTFSIQDKTIKESSITVPSKESVIQAELITAPDNADTVKASFRLKTTTGFGDGEERKIPILRKGTEETTGNFWVLRNDTTITFNAADKAGNIVLTARNNTIDILLDELDHLKQYPYYCMEQTASKLRGLIMEKQIRESLRQPFSGQEELNRLLAKLQKAQHFDGSWSWWENSNPDLNITNYIINALLPLRSNTLVETNIRNGLLYLENQLPHLQREQLIAVLSTMASTGHLMNYEPYLKKIPFDSISMHQQWQIIAIKQNIKADYTKELTNLLSKGTPTMLGGIYWGTENYRWYSNNAATTVLAYEVLEKDKKYKGIQESIIQYFLEQRKQSYWRNTVESASILSAILPAVLNTGKSAQEPTRLTVTGDTSFMSEQFPVNIKLSNNNKQLQVQKTGGGITYLTLYQKFWNNKSDVVKDNFEIKTYFERNGQRLAYIKSGEKIKMIATVDVKKEAEYVMIEIPIPAGCIYAVKDQNNWSMHKEFLKNKVMLFAEYLTKGEHRFEIELEPRYNGTFTLNPAKAELMYFPTFYGRNEIKKVEIKQQ